MPAISRSTTNALAARTFDIFLALRRSTPRRLPRRDVRCRSGASCSAPLEPLSQYLTLTLFAFVDG